MANGKIKAPKIDVKVMGKDMGRTGLRVGKTVRPGNAKANTVYIEVEGGLIIEVGSTFRRVKVKPPPPPPPFQDKWIKIVID